MFLFSELPGLLYRFRNLRTFRGDPLAFLTGLAQHHGDFVPFALGFLQFVLLNNPDFIKDVLVTHHEKFVKGLGLQRSKRLLGEGLLTSEGEFHKRQRRLVQPGFHREAIQSYGEIMVAYASRICEQWQKEREVDVTEEMRRLTLAIVAKTLFNVDVEQEATDIGEALTTAIRLFKLGMSVQMANFLYRLPIPSVLRYKRAQARLDGIIYRIIHERRASGDQPEDLLTMLLRAGDLEGDGSQMSDSQLRDEILTLFLAGHETTAIALTWTLYLLSEHLNVEERLHHELDTMLGSRLPTVNDLPTLTHTRMIFSEALRCYPPAWLISRMALEDHKYGGLVIPAGTHVFVSPYVLHHDQRYFPDPNQFKPDRWAPDLAKSQPPLTFIPFGAGPRNCIGEPFAWMEGVLVLATIAQRWRLRLVSGQRVEPAPLVTLRPKYGMRMVPHARRHPAWN